MNETWRVDQWLYATLRASATVRGLVEDRIYPDQAPQDAPMPCVIFALSDSEDYAGLAGHRGPVLATYIVKGVAAGMSYEPAAEIADAIDTALQRQSGTADSVTIVHCERDGEFRLAEDYPAGDEHYRHMGGRYLIWAEA